MGTSATANGREKKPHKRKKVQANSASPAKKQKYGSSSHVSTSSSSPITTTGKNNSNSSRSRSYIVPPPVWTSDEEDELASDDAQDADTDDDTLEERQKSSQLTDKERKAIAMKRLKKARKDKGEKFPYYSPAKKPRNTGRALATTNEDSKGYVSDGFNDLATQIPASDSDALAPMPWESDEDETSISKEVDEPIYEGEITLGVLNDLPPPLPRAERVWNRKARPPSRRDLFEATQRPASCALSPVQPEEDTDELPDLNLRTSSNTKYHDSTPRKGSVLAATLASNTRSIERQRSKSAEATFAKQPSPSPMSSQGIEEILAEPQAKDAGERPRDDDLHPIIGVDETPYWEDNSFMEGDFSISEDDLRMANLRPFFTPSPPRQARSRLPTPGPATMEIDKLIAAAEEQAETEEASGQHQASSAEASTSRPKATELSPAITPKISSSAKRASQTNGHVNGSPAMHSNADRTTPRRDKGKGRALQEDLYDERSMPRLDKGKGRAIPENIHNDLQVTDDSPHKGIALVSDGDEWSDFDELELTQRSSKATNLPKEVEPHATPNGQMSENKKVMSAKRRAVRNSSVEAGPSKVPSSEEESQPCSFCGNIYPIGSLPTHVEACQAAQISAAASHAQTAGTKGRSIFKYSEGPGAKSGPLRATLTTTTKKHNGAASATSNAGATQADQLEILLFGQPSIKARQMQESPPRRNKGKGRATDDSGDDLTSPDIPLRQMELVTRRPASRAHQKLAGDAIELDVGASTSGHSWRTSQNEPHRSKPIRAPDPHADLVIEVENDMQDLSSSPPTGSIFISQLPKNIQKGYFRLTGLDDEGQISSMNVDRLIQKRVPLPSRAPSRPGWFTRGRGRGRSTASRSSRAKQPRAKKK